MTIDGTVVKLHIWDTGGSERYRAMAPIYFQGAHAAVIVYDITSELSFNEVDNWRKELREKGPLNLVLALVGNKCDLIDNRKVDPGTAEEYAKQNDIQFFRQASALTGENIAHLFHDVASRVVASGVRKKEERTALMDQSSRSDGDSRDKKCC
jgi:small GTP-binding protein